MLELMTQSLAQSSLADRIGWVLIHSLWQFAIVALAAVVLQWALKRRSATARYWALLVAMLVMVAVPVGTWLSPWCVDASVVVATSGQIKNHKNVPPPQQVAQSQRENDTVTMTAVPAELPVDFMAKPQPDPQPLQPTPSSLAAWLSLVRQRVQAWLPKIVLLWLAGVLLAALRPLFSWYTVRRLRTVGVSPVGDMVHKVLERTAKRLRLERAVEVLQSTVVKTPVVVGYFRPVVLLPLCVVTGLPEAQLELILAHELAHIRRHDYLVNLLQTLVETLFFYHPAVWWLSRQIRNERENCCDDVAMATVGSRADYGRALLAIEELRASSPALSLASHGGSLLARIRRIAGCEPAPRVVGGGSILCVILFSIAIFAAVTWAAADKPQQPVANKAEAAGDAKSTVPSIGADAWRPGQVLDLHVINVRTKEPLPGVNLHLQFSGKGINFQDIKIQSTDAQGRSEIRLPDLKPDAVRVYTSKAGFVPLRVFWGSDDNPVAPPIIPKTVTIPMEPGTVWGGVIKNEQDEPIPNVKVNVRYWENHGEFNPHLRVNIDDDISGVTTDKDGRWRMDILPTSFTGDGPRLFLTHPDYVSDHLQRGMTPMPVTERPSYKALREQTAVLVMRKGATIAGRVTDESGKPISGAVICNQYDCYDPNPLRITATTDDEGHFRLTGLSHRQNYRDYFFTVQAADYAPVFVEVSDQDSAKPAEIKLTHGQAVQGQVVDEQGKPLEGVSIKLDYWMGRPRQFHLKTTTDADGRFRINDAPLERTEYDIGKSGYITVRKPLPPSSNDYRITLRRPLWVAGSIVDSETNEPLAKCRLIKGWDFEDGRTPQWETSIGYPAKEVINGRYEFKFTQEHGTRIRAEADGYMPAVSRMFKPGDTDNGHVTYDFRLKKAALISGTVLGLNDKPLAGAEVFIATQQFNVKNRKAGPPVGEKRRMVKTDEKGRFEFPPEVEPFYLVVLHDEGHVVLTEKQVAVMPTIRIQPWTSQNQTFSAERRPPAYAEKSSAADAKHTLIVRVIDLDGKPVEGAVVAAGTSFRAGYNYVGPNEPAWTYSRSAVADSDGMARIVDPYNRCVVARHVDRKLVGVRSISPGQIGGADVVTLTMQPQCSVSGRLTSEKLEAHGRKLTWTNVYVYLEDGMGRPMSCASNKGEYHFYLPPGTYKLDAYGTDVQHAWKTITVKPGQEELEVEPIDLPPTGLVLLEGKPAPELRDIAAWTNGGPVKLSDLRGRAVILAFTAKWSGEGSIMPQLLPLYEMYHDQGLTIIEIRLDMALTLGVKSKADLDEQIAKVAPPSWKGHSIPIPVAFVLVPVQPPKNSEGTGVAVIGDYGANVPSAVLIDRQGRVVGKLDLRSDRDNAVLEKMLKEK